MEQNFFDIDPRLEKLGEQAQLDCAQAFARTEEIGEYNSRKVLAAFLHNGVSESHFAGSTGYGYDDRGRETLEAVMAEITGSEDALMRHNFVSGTHTLTTALFGVLRPGDVMLSITGLPYDTIQPVIGITGENCGSLKEFDIEYRQVDLLPDGTPDLDDRTPESKEKRSHCRSGKGSPCQSGVCTALPRLFPAALHQHGHDGKADSDGAEKQSQGDFHGG